MSAVDQQILEHDFQHVRIGGDERRGAIDAEERAVGRLPEELPFLEWQHSVYNNERSCQGCHMPPVAEPTPIASVLGEPREGLSRHTFLGGNYFMLRMLDQVQIRLQGTGVVSRDLTRSGDD